MDVDRFVRRGQPVRPRRVVCFNCKKEGHYARDCREKVDLRSFTMDDLAYALANLAIPGKEEEEEGGKDEVVDNGNGQASSSSDSNFY